LNTAKDDTEDTEGLWSEEHQGFPWYMEEEAVVDQKWEVTALAEKGLDRSDFTPDHALLCKQLEHYVFVYGTLKRGKVNNRVIDNKNCVYIADAFTTDKSFLLKETQGSIPVLLSTFGQNDQKDSKLVKGELWLMRTPQIPRLDQFEQNGILYKRIKTMVSVEQNRLPAWTYAGIKNAWSDTGSHSSLKLCPHFKKSKDPSVEYYTYVGGPVRG
jgi:gamma-glutamylcyclotransferase (GGCT)/AIG2-like uncharacterized protein YtfP